MQPAVGHSLQLTVGLRAPLWHIGAGWAALGGALAAGALHHPLVAVSPPLGGLLTLALIWLLADLLLGTLWEMGAGQTSVWAKRPSLAPHNLNPPILQLPYSQPGSLAWRLAAHLTGRGIQEHAQPQEPATVSSAAWLGTLALTLMVAGLLGHVAVALVMLSASLSGLAVRLGDSGGTAPRSGLATGPAAVHALGVFGIPWLIGGTTGGAVTWPVALLGVCLTVVSVGILQSPLRFRLVVGGQLAMISLLLGMHRPLAAAVGGVALAAQWALATSDGMAADRLRAAVQPLILLALIVAAGAVGT